MKYLLQRKIQECPVGADFSLVDIGYKQGLGPTTIKDIMDAVQKHIPWNCWSFAVDIDIKAYMITNGGIDDKVKRGKAT